MAEATEREKLGAEREKQRTKAGGIMNGMKVGVKKLSKGNPELTQIAPRRTSLRLSELACFERPYSKDGMRAVQS